MSKSFRLQPILDLAAREAEKSAMKVGSLSRQTAEFEVKLELLLQYREEYVCRFREGMQVEGYSNGHQNFHQFMDRLDAAIAQQHAVVADARQQLRLAQAEHQDRERRLKAFDKLADRHAAAERLKAARSDQKALDEMAGNAMRQRMGSA
ncbi:MAG: flagellar export protein FliJ [Burkholderiales bacterium]